MTQQVANDDSRFANVPEWKRKLLEKKVQQKMAQQDPALAKALASKEEAERVQREGQFESDAVPPPLPSNPPPNRGPKKKF